MDGTALHAIEIAGRQLEACWAGLSLSGWDATPLPNILSPRQLAEHLCDCYRAAIAALKGESHDWGTYRLSDGGDPLEAWRRERAAAIEAIRTGDPEKAPHVGLEYLALHDAYHVGQLCAVRLALDPEWDAYSIYR
ncbi:MAG: hypothetical protein C4341_09345 [Armatimonadota bacterium]